MIEGGAQLSLSGFGDEISPDLDEQLTVLRTLGITHLELRSALGKNVLDLDDAEVERARRTLAERGMAVSAIASPIGKEVIECDFALHLQRFQRALELASAFNAAFIRIFSFFVPSGKAHAHREEVLRRMAAMVERAERAGVVLLHENERSIYGETPERCRDLLDNIASPSLKAAFDPGNFVQVGVRPFDHAFPILAEHIAYVHIKDARLSDGAIVLPGAGDSQIPDLLGALYARGFRGFLSMEPHLAVAGPSSGFSGPEGFVQATTALRRLLVAIPGDQTRGS